MIEDYSGAFASQSPLQAFGQSYQLGAGIRNDQFDNQQKIKAQQAMDAALNDTKGDPALYSRAVALNPEKFAGLTYAHKTMNNADKMGKLRAVMPSIAALWNNQPERAASLMEDQASRHANASGTAMPESQYADPSQKNYPEDAPAYTPALRWSQSLNAPPPAAGQGPLPPPNLPPDPASQGGLPSPRLPGDPQAPAPEAVDDSMHIPRWPPITQEDHDGHAQGLRNMAKFTRAEPQKARALATMTLASILADDPDSYNRIMAGLIQNDTNLQTAPYRVQEAAADASGKTSDAIVKQEMARTAPQTADADLQGLQADTRGKVADAAVKQEDARVAPGMADAKLQNARGVAATSAATGAVAPRQARANVRLTEAQSDNIDSEIQDRPLARAIEIQKAGIAAATAQAAAKQKAGKIPDPVYKTINDAGAAQADADAQAGQFDTMADRVRDAHLSGFANGGLGKLREMAVGALGWQDYTTNLKAEADRLRTTAAVRAYTQYAKGSFSNKDLETAMRSTPGPNDGSVKLESYFRGMGTLARLNALQKGAEAIWLASNTHLGPATEDMEIDGFHIARGVTFSKFLQSYIPAKMDETNAQKTAANTDQVAGMSFAHHGR